MIVLVEGLALALIVVVVAIGSKMTAGAVSQ